MANMFGALNRFISRLDSDPNNIPQTKNFQGNGQQQPGSTSQTAHAFQVLRNTNPDLPLEPWFDYLIGLNGHSIDASTNPQLLSTELSNCAGSTISLGIYSAKGQTIREIYAPIPTSGTLLGVSLQWSPLAAADDVWHILDVMPNSPADVAGLLPYSDYVIGSPERGSLRGEGALGELVESFIDRPLRLWVYNHEYDVCRLVTISPARNWGGEGALGCVLGFGALHRLPAPLGEPSQGPGETLFESGDVGGGVDYSSAPAAAVPAEQSMDEKSAFLVPADMAGAISSPPPPSAGAGTAPPPPPSSGGSKAKKQRAHAAPAAGLDDYFAEGEQKSRELDHGSSSKPSASLAPPPKGGPPRAASPAAEKTEETAAE